MNLILGDGLLATALIGRTSWPYISRKKDDLEFTNLCKLNSLVPKGTRQIINLIANTNTYSEDISSMFDVNYRAVTELVDFCNQRQIKLVHFSTDYVYENSVSQASEEDKVQPTTVYAMSKALADEYIIKHSNDYLICRGSHKVEPFDYEYAWDNVRGNFDYVDEIVELFYQLITGGATGLYNIGTVEKTMFELAIKTSLRVKPRKAPDHFPKDVTMDLTKMNNFLNYGKKTT